MTLWQNIDKMIKNKEIVICIDIYKELKTQEYADWIDNNQCVILDIDDDIQKILSDFINKNDSHKLINFSKNKSSADAFIIATAMKYKLAVITEESKTSPYKIPQICKKNDIKCYSINEFAEIKGWKF
jgi:hypothetical protein